MSRGFDANGVWHDGPDDEPKPLTTIQKHWQEPAELVPEFDGMDRAWLAEMGILA